MKFVGACLIIFSAVLVSAQNYNRPIRQRTRNYRDSTARQGRTLGVLGPLVGWGASSLSGIGNFNLVGYDPSIAPYRQRRPARRPLADPYYDSLGGGGGFYNRFGGVGIGGYNSYGGYKPSYGFKPNYGLGGILSQFGVNPALSYGYRPAVFPGAYDGYSPINFQSQSYGGAVTATSSPAGNTVTSSVTAPIAGTAAAPPASSLNGAQAAEVANLLGQLLGSQLRPLINSATADDTSSDDPNSKRLY